MFVLAWYYLEHKCNKSGEISYIFLRKTEVFGLPTPEDCLDLNKQKIRIKQMLSVDHVNELRIFGTSYVLFIWVNLHQIKTYNRISFYEDSILQ